MPRPVLRLAVLLVLATGAPAAPAAAAPQGPVTDQCRSVAEELTTPCYGADVVVRDVEATADPGAYEDDIRAFEESWTARALDFQAALAGDVGMVDAPWVGTHNSFNSIAEMGPTVSDTDSNQRLTLVDQLRIGVRSLELDVHWFPTVASGGEREPVVCHAEANHEGCSTERTLSPVLAPVGDWLRAHPREVLLLYLEDHLDEQAGYDAGAAAVDAQLGDLVFRPPGGGACTELPGALTRDDVLAAGKQVVIVSGCGTGAAWRGVAFAWSGHRESRPRDFEDFPGCGPDFSRADYDTRLVRYFEDSTWLTTAASEAGAASGDDGLTPATTAAMLRCGVDLLGFDQLVPGDGRLDAAVWSWATGQPGAADGDCAIAGSDARWRAAACSPKRPAACRTADGSWELSKPSSFARADEACARQGATFAAPRTGYENALLGQAAGDRSVLLGLTRGPTGWRAVDAR